MSYEYGDLEMIFKYENIQEHKKWRSEIPYIKFPKDWEIQITPSFGGAVVRFCVKYKDKHVSVYLDCYDRLGYFGSPYWEIYPYEDDVYRVGIKEIDELIENISYSLDYIGV